MSINDLLNGKPVEWAKASINAKPAHFQLGEISDLLYEAHCRNIADQESKAMADKKYRELTATQTIALDESSSVMSQLRSLSEKVAKLTNKVDELQNCVDELTYGLLIKHIDDDK